jgi:Hint domain
MSAPPVCYLEGTNIKTINGECKVEALAIGDMLITVEGHVRPVKWVGRMSYKKTNRAWQRSVLPIQISTGALGNGLPLRDLYVSQKHKLFMNNMLVSAEDLLNGETIKITTCGNAPKLTYFHVALETHDAILAEGQPAETLRTDAANREKFENFMEYLRLYPGEAGAVNDPRTEPRKTVAKAKATLLNT